jgi:hypothetical protein
MQVHCPKCGRAVPGDDIELRQSRALCRPCGEVIALPAAAAEPTPRTTSAFRPADLRWKEQQDGAGAWRFQLTPGRLGAVFLAVFAAGWDTFLLFWYYLAFTQEGGPGGIMVWFPVLHVLAGVGITYAALCGLFNDVFLTLDRERFTCRQQPIPARGRIEEPLTNVAGFRTAQKVSGSKDDSSVTHQVLLFTHDGRSRMLPLVGIERAEHAEYVAARLERLLDELRTPQTYRG